jgi:hypothetical protein
METSILTSTKKVLGIAQDYTVFDSDLVMHINSIFGILCQLGVGPVEGFMIEDDTNTWDEYDVPQNQMNLVKTYIFLRVRLLFDPPTTSFLIGAVDNQIREYEWRLNMFREEDIPWTEPIPLLLDETVM